MAENRRDFLKKSSLFVGGCCAGFSLGLMGCTTARYVPFEKEASWIKLNKADFLSDKYVLLNVPELPAPVYVKKVNDEHYKAFLMLCTHKGCDVKPAGAIMVCPCHGSEFSSEGKVLKGPAIDDLLAFPVQVNNQTLQINIAQ